VVNRAEKKHKVAYSSIVIPEKGDFWSKKTHIKFKINDTGGLFILFMLGINAWSKQYLSILFHHSVYPDTGS
jgi:hypothetical protein